MDPRVLFGRLPSDRPKVPTMLFEMPELGNATAPLPSLRLGPWWSVPVLPAINVRPPFSL
jgi:hypothetical protein